jgi:flagellar hook protein FlgE
MGLFSAMTASVSGLGAQGQAISVISDNLANTNTIGYKSSRSLFSQLVTSAGSGGTAYNSGGVATNVTRDQAAQGSFISSTSKTDLAIAGNGFFRVADNKTNSTSTSYYFTRAGSFAEDREGYLVNPDGFYLQGWQTDSDGTIVNIQDPKAIALQSVGVSAQESTELSIDANLTNTTANNSNYLTTSAVTATLDGMVATPTQFDYVSDLRVYDAQGGARDLTIGFSKRAANLWDWTVYTDGANVQGGTTGTNTRIGNGTLQFSTTGSLKYATGTTVDVTWAGGVDSSAITMNFGDYTGGKIATPAAGALYTNHVMDIAVEDEAFATGTYTLRRVSATEMGLYDATGSTLIESAPIGTTGKREVYFTNSKVRMTVSTTFDELSAGLYPDTVGQFTVSDQPELVDGLGTDGITQLAASFNTSSVNQNGFGAGTLAGIEVDEDGFVNGTFTNGETKKLFKIALAVFQNPRGLEAISGSLLRTTEASGQALLKQAGLGGTGRLVGGSLEGSTTDIAGEFSTMIVAQRAFQASSKVITTVDQMLNELLQLR